MADLLELVDVSAGYGRIEALSGVSLRVPEGGIVALLGANGAGKTTTLNVISGIVAPTRGEVRLAGRPLRGLGSDAVVAAGISQVPEGREIFRDMSVHENLVIGAHARRDKAGIARDIEVMTGYFPILAKRFRQMAGTMSGGEQQMLSTARTILGQPSVLLLDEPLEGLAPVICEELMAAFSRLAQSGETTILLVEQRIQSALDFADRVMIMERGRIAWSGTPQALAEDHNTVDRLLGVGGLH